MTRKRFKKLLMAKGVSRNTAEEILNIIVMGHRGTKAMPRYGSVTPSMRASARRSTDLIFASLRNSPAADIEKELRA